MHFQLVSRKYSNHLENKKRFTRFCFLYDSRNFLETAEKKTWFQYFLAVFVGFLYGSLVAVVVIAGQDNAPSKGCMNNSLFVSNKTPLTRVEGGRAKHRFREASRRTVCMLP